jgi:predicted  nucleic acid-binding Zn-ribbon protein
MTEPQPEWAKHLNAELMRMRNELGNIGQSVRGLNVEIKALQQSIAQLTETVARLTRRLDSDRQGGGGGDDGPGRD